MLFMGCACVTMCEGFSIERSHVCLNQHKLPFLALRQLLKQRCKQSFGLHLAVMESCYLDQLQQLCQLAAVAAAPAAATAATAASKFTTATAHPKVLDARPKHRYVQQRLLHSVNIHLTSLTTRCYLLPDKSECFAVIVPSSNDYTIVQEESQHGMQLADGSVAVCLKGAASLSDFLTSRGWTKATFLQDCPQLWSAAQQLQLIEQQQLPEQLLARRCLFTPSQLLASQIGEIEAALAVQRLQQQQQQQQLAEQCKAHQRARHGQSAAYGACSQQQPQQQQQQQLPCDHCRPHEQVQCHPPAAGVARLEQHQQQQQRLLDLSISCSSSSSCTALPVIVLHALDLGCGSGRDLCWLASRQRGVNLPACKQHAHQQSQPELQSSTNHIQQQQLQQCQKPQLQMQSREDSMQQQQQVQVAWHVTGVDNWIGALERVHNLAAAMQLDQQQVELVVADICSKSGDIVLQRLPASSTLHAAASASVVHAATSGNSSSSSTADGMLQAPALPQAAAEEGRTAAVEQPGCSFCSSKFRPTGKYDLILCVRFLERALLPRLKAMLTPGGFVLYSTFVDGPGLRAFGRPSGADHVLQPGELADCWLGPNQGFTVLRDDVTLTGDGREVCMFAAQLCIQ